MKYKIKAERLTDIQEDINELVKLLTDRIADLHKVPGGMQARHAYVLYRERLWGIRDGLNKHMKEIPFKPAPAPEPKVDRYVATKTRSLGDGNPIFREGKIYKRDMSTTDRIMLLNESLHLTAIDRTSDFILIVE